MSDERPALAFSEAELVVLRDKYAKFSPAEFDAFLAAARRYQLNPLANQIYARLQEATQRNPRSVTYAAQIDGYRLIADRTGAYAGNDDPIYDNEKSPAKATVAVYKLVSGQKCKFEASARWDQYCPTGNQDFMWRRMPHLMLGKCAEALALRKAFPAELSGLYTLEEMQQADSVDPAPTDNPYRDQQREREPHKAAPAMVPGQPTLKERITNAGSAAELTKLLQEEVGLNPVKEHVGRWKAIGVDAKAKIEASTWPDTHKEAALAVLAGIRNQLVDAKAPAPSESNSVSDSVTPPPATPASEVAPLPATMAHERLAGWIDQQGSPQEVEQAVNSMERSAKFAPLRAHPAAMAAALDYAIDTLHTRCDAGEWDLNECNLVDQAIRKIKGPYDTEAQSIDAFGNSPEPATPASGTPAG